MPQSVVGNGVAKNDVYGVGSQPSSIILKKGTTTYGALTFSYEATTAADKS